MTLLCHMNATAIDRSDPQPHICQQEDNKARKGVRAETESRQRAT